ncbi:MAG: pyruvate, phosphate dikinase, partial [Promethearchaeota archaeon]
MTDREQKRVYLFSEGNKDMKLILGGKGANLAEMKQMGLPIPPGFTITCQTCLEYFDDKDIIDKIRQDVLAALESVEKETGRKFGDVKNPLLVSVRSGAPVSMPGMMDTVLNLGMNEKIVEALIKKTGNKRFVLDSYRRFIQMFANVVMGVDIEKFDKILTNYKKKHGEKAKDTDLTAEDFEGIIKEYKELYRAELGSDFPEDPMEQLFMAIEAVFKSWNNKRAIAYRQIHKVPNYGTAVNVQAMVYGNMGDDSATGVAFTRNPATGEKKHYGDFLKNAQGEDVVAGIRTPMKIEQMAEEFPDAYKELVDIFNKLEHHYKDMQDIEFTIENNKLYILQTRTGKRTGDAYIKIATDMLHEGLIDEKQALMQINAYSLEQVLHPRVKTEMELKMEKKFDEIEMLKRNFITTGVAASPGAAIGKIVLDADTAVKLVLEEQEKVILCRPETKPDDVQGMKASQGVLTQRGGKTSHAAVVARGMGIPCVTGAEELNIDVENKTITYWDKNKKDYSVLKEGDVISIDGNFGRVYVGRVPIKIPELTDDFKEILKIADKYRRLGVRANADTPVDAKKSIEYGAEGIGLCRTEHMFMAKERLPIVQQMILAETEDELNDALNKIEKMQTSDFYEILKVMAGKPVIIRLLDPPLHEFLPSLEKLIIENQELKLKGGDEEKLKENEKLLKEVRAMSEANPMLGLRGCRLGIMRPEINAMQVRAIMNAS